jgi:hypothetical protein
MKPPLAVRLALACPWCFLLVGLAVAAAVDRALDWLAGKERGPPD